MKNIRNLFSYLKKGYIDFCCQTPPSSQNGHVRPQIILSSFFRKCDAIQQKVHKVGKLVFPNAVEIGRGDRKEHLKKK